MESLRALLDRATTVAVVGASRSPEKAASRVPAQLIRAGFHVVPVNPSATEIHGLRAYPSLADVPVPVDIVNVFRPAREAPDIAAQAVAIGAKALWLQLGVASPAARKTAETAGLAYVEDLCIGQQVRALGIRKPNPGPRPVG